MNEIAISSKQKSLRKWKISHHAFCHNLDNNNNGSRYLDVSINGL